MSSRAALCLKSYSGTSVSPDNRRGRSWRNAQGVSASARSSRRITSNRASFHCEGTPGTSWPPRSAGSRLLAIALCSQHIRMTPVRLATAAASSRSSPFAKSVFGSIFSLSANGTMVWCGRRLGSGSRSLRWGWKYRLRWDADSRQKERPTRRVLPMHRLAANLGSP